MIEKRGVKVTHAQLARYLTFVENCGPWFPKDGSLNIRIWNKIGEEMQLYYSNHGPENVPVEAFSLWTLLRDMLDPMPSSQALHKKLWETHNAAPAEETSLLQKSASHVLVINEMKSEDEDKDNKTIEGRDDQLSSKDEVALEEEAAKYHEQDWELFANATVPECGSVINLHRQLKVPQNKALICKKPLPPIKNIGFKGAIQEALRDGDLTFKCFPVTFDDEWDESQWEPLPYKVFRELKKAVSDYGSTSPYTMQLVEAIASRWMTPYDWHQTAKSCLPAGVYLLWKAEYEELAKQQIAINRKSGRRSITFDMLMGLEEWSQARDQLNLSKEALSQSSSLAVNAWRYLPAGEVKTIGLSNIKQSPEEPYQDFLAKIIDAVEKTIPNDEAAQTIIKQLAFENANATCQTLIRPIRKTGTLNDFVKVCSEVTPSYLQGIAIAAALQGQTSTQFLANINNPKLSKPNGPNNNSTACFSCGQISHFSRHCPQKLGVLHGSTSSPTTIAPPKTLCPRCNKGFHWSREGKSKYHKNGTLLPPNGPRPENNTPNLQLPTQNLSGNWVWGPTQAPQITGNSNNPFSTRELCQTSQKLPMGVQDWTCAPPPQQY
ncbi:endogenous retrovirus group K member 5 Gag polyprotein-like [Leptonychotes weddellii]|uniref:Endogenous retrovirus group K member 5 Gag polyprotein-like n=1 Tax=Leptonychotes weddellii TaxID=9713 RepID=A0A7F8RWM2_LEPWE|nr:endogenous retrovirus group K member 5 Gag polyprotein-like [Leptonychotes weddellii]